MKKPEPFRLSNDILIATPDPAKSFDKIIEFRDWLNLCIAYREEKYSKDLLT